MTKENKIQDRQYRPLVYVCSAFAGDVEENLKKTRTYCRYALDQGQIPLAPHLLFSQFMHDEDPVERELAILMDLVLLGKCHELWAFGDHVSEGMQKEIQVAKRRRQPIRYFNCRMEEVKYI